MLVPIFSLNLKHKINLKQVCAGKFDTKTISLAGATNGGKVFLHNPGHIRFGTGGQGNVDVLNINQSVTCLTSANFDNPQDLLIVGTSENIMAYDVFNNRDIFNKEVSDKATVVTVGRFGIKDELLVLVGGNCSIQGFNFKGDDCFWTVTGDNVCSLAMMDFDGDGMHELLVGSEDFDIRIFKGDEILTEISENEIVNNLHPLISNQFIYTLMNGTIGVYESSFRNWRIKSKNIPNVVTSFDVNNDGVNELITGWSNGKFDGREIKNGDTVFKETLSNGLAGLIVTDYRLDGHNILMCCCLNGTVEAFSNDCIDSKAVNQKLNQDLYQELINRKTNLLLELKNYEANNKVSVSSFTASEACMAVIPANTQVQSHLYVTSPEDSFQKGTVELCICTTNESVIHAIVIFAEGIFEEESLCIHIPCHMATNKVQIPLYPSKDVPVDLYIKVFVGSKSSNQLHVFEIMRSLPRFSMYLFVNGKNLLDSPGHVQFDVTERINRICLWVNQNFLLPEDLTSSDALDVQFVCLRTSSPLRICVNSSGQALIKTNDMELAGEILQHLCSFLSVQHISSEAHFPEEFSRVSELFSAIHEYHATKIKLSTEMIDNSNLSLSYIVGAEDARILGSMKIMKQMYMSLMNINKGLFNYCKIRNNNHKELADLLKKIHLFIQKAAKLRYGKFKADVINGCKEAFKNGNPEMFIKVMKVGTF